MIAKVLVPFLFGVLVAASILAIRQPVRPGVKRNPQVDTPPSLSERVAKTARALDTTVADRDENTESAETPISPTRRSDINTLTSAFIKIRRAIMRTTLHNIELEMKLAEQSATEIDPEFEAILEERRRLRAAPTSKTSFSRARLGDVFALLASEAEMSFVAPENLDMSSLISWEVNESPFATIESVAHSMGYLLAKDGDDWTLQPALDEASSSETDQALARLLREVSPDGSETHLFREEVALESGG